MPRPGPRRPLVAVRMDDETVAALDRIAEDLTARNRAAEVAGLVGLTVTRSDVVREAVAAYLKRHAAP